MSVPVQESTNPAETFPSLDVLGSIPPPPSAVEATFADGFLLNNGMEVRDGVILLNSEVFRWMPVQKGGLEESKAKTGGVLELAEEAWGLLDVVYPKPGWFTSHPLPRYHYSITLLCARFSLLLFFRHVRALWLFHLRMLSSLDVTLLPLYT